MIKNKINGKTYIGQTIRPITKRFEQHQKSSACRAIYNAIQKYGWDDFEKDWYECPDKDLNFDEELLVREMKTMSPEGYNLREGGGSHGKPSEESNQKNRESHIGKTMSEKAKQEIRKANIGKPRSKESKQKQSESIKGENHHMYGKTRSQETKQQIREANRGERNHNSKKVYQYHLDGTFIASFESCGEAARNVEGDNSSISKCARDKNGRHNTAHGFKWSYTKY